MTSPFLQPLEMMYCDDYMPQQSHMYFKSWPKSEAFLLWCQKWQVFFFFFSEILFIYRGRVDGGRDTVLGDVRLDLPPRILSERADVLLLATKELYGFLCLAQGQHIGLSALKLGEFVLGLSSYFNHLIGQEGGEKKQCGDVTLASQPFRLPPLRRRRRIISLRLFGAAPVFSCVAPLIQTWCIAGLQTMV